MRQLKQEKIASLILNAEELFIKTMFVLAEKDIKDNAKNRYECFGIVIPYDLLQKFIERWFECLTENIFDKSFIRDSRLFENVTFRSSLCIYIRQLKTEKKASLFLNGNEELVSLMFVMAENDIKDNSVNRYECFGIVIPDDMLQKYIAKWFKCLTTTRELETFIDQTRPIRNITFRTALFNFTRQLNTEKISSLLWSANRDFINTMFVMAEDDIKGHTENRFECFGIVLPDDLLQQYIERWFESLSKTSGLEKYIDRNRPMKNIKFRTALFSYMRQLNTEKIASLIWNAGMDFINIMFVMAEEDIKDNTEHRFECFGIVIPDDLLQQYIERLFQLLSKINKLEEYMGKNRPIKNVTFRTALCNYMRQFNTDKIVASNILYASGDFFNKMFVIAEEDINENTENRFECFGIVIPDELLQQYIERWFQWLTKISDLETFIDKNRPIKNVTFRIVLNEYHRQFSTEKIASLIWNANDGFVNTMFVMAEEDIKDNTDNRYECFGIVIPDGLLQQYIERWFEGLTKTSGLVKYIDKNRPIKNVTFRTALYNYLRQFNTEKIASLIWNADGDFINTMFVMTEDDIKDDDVNRYECFGIVIPDDLLHQYIERWFEGLTKTSGLVKDIDKNRPIKNVTFRIVLNEYMRQFNTEKIASLIWNADGDFINTMFVMAEDDIKDNAVNRYECFGIVIPDDLLQQYIERWFEGLTKTSGLVKDIDKNRPIKNVTFRIVLKEYMRQFNTEKIASLIWNADGDFINTMFVMAEDDIKDDAVNRYECFGIIIPVDFLQQFIERMFDGLTKADSVKRSIDSNRCFMNDTYRISLQTYIKQLTRGHIATLIWTGSRDFVNTMFVMREYEIKENDDNRYECFGIIIPVDLLQHYIGRLMDVLTKTNSVTKCLNFNRCIMDVSFRISLKTYMKELTRGNIENLIRTGSKDFVNTMFVMTDDDIKENFENRQECFGIILPDDFLHQYIERWFNGMTKTDSAQQYIDVNRTFINSKFQAHLDSYISGMNAEKIALLNRKGHIDYLNTRREFLKDNSTSEIKS